MTPVKTSLPPISTSLDFNVPNEYLSAFLSNEQEKINPVKLAEIKTIVQQHTPKIMTFFPMGGVPWMIGASTLDAVKSSFESLADKTEALSKTGFSAKQIVRILSGSGSEIAVRADEVIRFTQPKLNYNNQFINEPSDLSYVLSAGLSHEHISNMLFQSGDHLSANIKALSELVTPSIQSIDTEGRAILLSPLDVLEETGLPRESISRIFGSFSSGLESGIKRFLYLTRHSQSTPFHEVFKEENIDDHTPEILGAEEMTVEDANDILEMLGTDSHNHSEESLPSVIGGEPMTTEDANDVLEMFGADNKVDERKETHHEESSLLGEIDDMLLDDRDYISDMFNADLYPLGP